MILLISREVLITFDANAMICNNSSLVSCVAAANAVVILP